MLKINTNKGLLVKHQAPTLGSISKRTKALTVLVAVTNLKPMLDQTASRLGSLPETQTRGQKDFKSIWWIGLPRKYCNIQQKMNSKSDNVEMVDNAILSDDDEFISNITNYLSPLVNTAELIAIW